MGLADYDLCIIGGGINGAGIARDAAGRGLSVLLVEQGDLAAATSSASTKLIHGGLRYLEHFEFGLVRHALAERETLMRIAPHIISPLGFILPHDETLRPAWMIRAGLFLYDHLARRDRLPASKAITFSNGPLKENYKKGFRYADCWADDARLVVLNALDAQKHGAKIRTRTACTKIKAAQDFWIVQLDNAPDLTARSVINAAGPWARIFLEHSGLADHMPGLRLVKGSHIIVPRFLKDDNAYILQQPDRRIVFAIPYEEKFTLVGTTDVEYKGDPAKVAIQQKEIYYLCTAINRSFKHHITPGDVVYTYSGLRPLLDDGDQNASSVTRDYKLVLDESHGPKLLSVFGGKLTTYRHLAEEAVDQFTAAPRWTSTKTLPGGDIPHFEQFTAEQARRYSMIPDKLVLRYARLYGTRMDIMLKNGLGKHFGDDLYEAEVSYLVNEEWAQTVEDILWRRTKLGLHVSLQTVQTLEKYLNGQKS